MQKLYILLSFIFFIFIIKILIGDKHAKNNPPYLKGFTKCTDPKVVEMIEKMFSLEINFNLPIVINKTDLPKYDIEVSHNSSLVFNYEFHPYIDGYEFYRGYSFKIYKSTLMIFVGWAKPHPSHPALVYTKGNLPTSLIQTVVNDFFEKMTSKIGKSL